MKNFVKENWYKLMIGSSLFIFSVGFFINSVSPVYSSNTNKEKTEIKNTNLPVGTNGVNYNDGVLFVDGGYVYSYRGNDCYDSKNDNYWTKRKLP